MQKVEEDDQNDDQIKMFPRGEEDVRDCGYRVTHLVVNLGCVYFDLGCSTILLGQ